MQHLREISPWAWFGLLIVGALGVLAYLQFANDPGDVTWTDPQQPPAMVALPLGISAGRMMRSGPCTKSYPESLAAWDGTVVGDC